MNFIGIIPARYASTRFPGKPLVDIAGKTMIRRVYERASLVLDHVIVATDDDRIYNEVKTFGGEVVMTSTHHKSGTDRCSEALFIYESSNCDKKPDVVINIQGDEPFVNVSQLTCLKSAFTRNEVDIATLVAPITTPDDIFNPNCVKAVLSASGNAIYFSRSPIPYIRGISEQDWYKKHTFYRHIGLYAYRADVLRKITKLAPSPLETAESLEQNRWLENNYIISASVTEHESPGIDTPEDLERVLTEFKDLLS